MISRYRERLQGYLRSYAFNLPADLIRQRSQRLDELRFTLGRIAAHRAEVIGERLRALTDRLHNLDPVKILERGYVIVSRGGRTVSSAAAVKPGEFLDLKFHDGTLRSRSLGRVGPGNHGKDGDAEEGE